MRGVKFLFPSVIFIKKEKSVARLLITLRKLYVIESAQTNWDAVQSFVVATGEPMSRDGYV